jgi:type IV secretory pathway VirB10-like protein
MDEPLEMPSPPPPKRLNRLALVAVLVLLGVAMAAVFLTLVPQKPARVPAEPPVGGSPERPSFLDRAPAQEPPARRPAAAESPRYWEDALREARRQAGAGREDASGRTSLDGAEEPAASPGGATLPVRPALEHTATPAPSSRAQAYRSALVAPVAPAKSATEVGEPTGDGSAERVARLPGVAGAYLPVAAPTGQLPDGAAASPPAAGAGGGGRDHQAFLRSAESLLPVELKVRRDRAGQGIVVEAGTVIPAALVSAVDSDVAGPLIAQVTQDVFDRNQREVAIPRGSRLVGAYDSQVALGERRLLVAWSRVIFPDGSGLSLPGLPSATKSGEAGLSGSVNNHLARVFGSAILLSVISAGVQLSQPQESASFGMAAGTRQIAAAAVGQELSSVAIEMLRRQMSVPPTIRIAAGTSFYVFLKGDLRLEEPLQE